MTDRCVVCDWHLEGTSGDPRPEPVGNCHGGSPDPRCAVTWLSADPEDREPYDAYLAGVGAR